MRRKLYPCEIATCLRCGVRRQVNASLKRKDKSTSLCKDCFMSIEWTCPVCDETMLLNARGIHLYHSHNLKKEDL